jgi:DnaK suppressor protein
MAQKKTVSPMSATRKATAKKQPASKEKAPAAARKPSGTTSAVSKPKAKEMEEYRKMLLALRDRLSGQISALKSDSLTRDDAVNSEEDGTDAFDRQFALNIASSENNALRDIDEALWRIGEGTYGVCERCSGLIERPRLTALPFVRNCIKCQSELEKQSPGYRTVLSRETA